MNNSQILMKGKMLAICVGLLVAISACDNDNKKTTKTSAEKILGIWEQPGYGNVFVVEGKQTTEYEFTRATCLNLGTETGRFGMTEKEVNDADISFSNNDSEFLITEKGGVFASRFKRLTKLPENCQSNLAKNTPIDTFEHFWNTFNDYYAFNTERGIDWSERYAAVSGKISNDMTGDELFAALSEIISPLDDGHTSIVSDNDEFHPVKIKGLVKFIEDTFQSQTEFSDIDKFTSTLLNQYFTVLTTYLDGEMKIEKEMIWGITHESVGFLQINGMDGYTQTDDPDLEEEVAAVKTLLDRVMTDLQDTPAMIIDLRFNGGGTDAVSLAIAGRFTDQRLKVMSKTARIFSGETAPVEAYINPEGKTPYLKPVVIIAGPDTASAAEIFLIAMSNLSSVTVIGEPSNGALSDILDKELPNGWAFGLSNEVYLDQSGKSFEVTGIIPQTEVVLFSVDDLENERNSVIEAALKMLGFSNSQ